MAKSSFFSGLDDQARADLNQSILSSVVLREHLLSYLHKENEYLEKESRDKANYNKAGWPYMQADIIGGKRSNNKLIELLKTLDK